ncbi:transcription factor FapR, partial [Staphylococcus arlettae]
TFLKPVKLNDVVTAEAYVINNDHKYYEIEVKSYVKEQQVFGGTFKMYYTSEDEGNG